MQKLLKLGILLEAWSDTKGKDHFMPQGVSGHRVIVKETMGILVWDTVGIIKGLFGATPTTSISQAIDINVTDELLKPPKRASTVLAYIYISIYIYILCRYYICIRCLHVYTL